MLEQLVEVFGRTSAAATGAAAAAAAAAATSVVYRRLGGLPNREIFSGRRDAVRDTLFRSPAAAAAAARSALEPSLWKVKVKSKSKK